MSASPSHGWKRVVVCFAILLVGCGDRVSLGELPSGEPGASPAAGNTPPPAPGGGPAEAGTDGGSAEDGGGAIDGGSAPWIPCAGKACGATCTLCAPDDAGCVETAVLKFCHPGGACKDMPPACAPPPTYEPCAGKACGAPCTLCDPQQPGCVEPAVPKQCNAGGQCSASAPGC
jgi:hypothetical protein